MRTNNESLKKWFIGAVTVLIAVSMPLMAAYIYQQVELGVLCLWPYVAFVVFLALIFSVYHAAFEAGRAYMPMTQSSK